MSTPDFILELRKHIGHAPLWLIGITAVVTDDAGRLLLVQRSDDGRWTPVTGIVDPGEHPTLAAARECLEEAAVTVRIGRLAQVGVTATHTFGNGDVTQFLDLTYRCHYVGGDPHPADGENTAVNWFDLAELPTLDPHFVARVDAALSDESEPRQVLIES